MFGRMLLASLLLHAFVIATLTFAPPDPKVSKDKMPPLEVVLHRPGRHGLGLGRER